MSGDQVQHIRHNVISSLVTVCPSRSSVHRFLGLTSTKQRATTKCTGGESNEGPLGPKSDALSTAPLRPSLMLIIAVVFYLLHSTCILPRVSLFEQKTNKKQQSRVLLAPVAGTIWFMSDMVGNRGFSCVGLMFGWANIHASATCIIAFFVCCSIGSAPHYHTCLTHQATIVFF